MNMRFQWCCYRVAIFIIAAYVITACDGSKSGPNGSSAESVVLTAPVVRIEAGSARIFWDGGAGGMQDVVASDRASILRNDGTLWFGGTQVRTDNSVFAVSGRYAITRDGSLWTIEFRANDPVLEKIAEVSGVKSVLARRYSTGQIGHYEEPLMVLMENGVLMFRNNPDEPLRAAGLDDVQSMDISLDYQTFYALRKDGTVWGWGDGSRNQLGDPNHAKVTVPVAIAGLSNIKAIAAGNRYLLALQNSGQVFSLGANALGQLGNGNQVDTAVPTAVIGLNNIVAIGVGDSNWSVAVDVNNDVYFWGNQSLQHADYPWRADISRVVSLTDIMSVATKTSHALALKNDGTVWAWGRNDFGQLGFQADPFWLTPRKVKSLESVKQIAAGHNFSAALKLDGTVWVWGYTYRDPASLNARGNRHEPIRLETLTNIVAIDAGHNVILALDSNGQVWKWGNDASNARWHLPIDDLPTLSGPPTLVTGLDNVAAVYAGSGMSVVKKIDGSFWSWQTNAPVPDFLREDTVDGALEISVTDEIYYRKADSVSSNTKFWQIPENMNQNEVQLSSLSVGLDWGAAIKSDGTVWFWPRTHLPYFQGVTHFNQGWSEDMTRFVGKNILTRIVVGDSVVGLDTKGNVWSMLGWSWLASSDAQQRSLTLTPQKVSARDYARLVL